MEQQELHSGIGEEELYAILVAVLAQVGPVELEKEFFNNASTKCLFFDPNEESLKVFVGDYEEVDGQELDTNE